MNIYIQGIKEPDNNWKEMKKVWDSCKEAGVNPPDSVREYFNYEDPDDDGIIIDLKDKDYIGCLNSYKKDGKSGFQIALDDLPEDVSLIRFCMGD